jgi:hypothetical protein
VHKAQHVTRGRILEFGRRAFPNSRYFQRFLMPQRDSARAAGIAANRESRFALRVLRMWRRIVGAAGVAAMFAFSAAQPAAQASYCGSYVLSNATGHGQHADGAMGSAIAHRGKANHIPTPCELGFCNAPSHGPAMPPSVPTNPSINHLLLQLSATISLESDSESQLVGGLVHPCPGFQHRLDRPPESTHL